MVISATPMEPSPPMQKMEILQKQKSPEISKVDNVVIDELLKGGGIKKVSDREESDKQISKEQTREIADNLNKMVKLVSGRLQFKVHEGTGRIIIRVVDIQTNEVVREIPPEYVLNADAKIRDVLHLLGILMDEKA